MLVFAADPGSGVGVVSSTSFNPSYVGPRDDVVRRVPETAHRVLDFGCSVGALGARLKALRPQTEVWGLELDPAMGAEAEGHLDRVIIGDLNRPDLLEGLPDEGFDALVFADVLEHLVDPWALLRGSTRLLVPGGRAVICLPNVQHWSTLLSLAVLGRWPYRDRGIHDRTHLRFFTLKNARELVASAGLELDAVHRNYRIIERPNRANAVARAFAWPGLRDFLTFQLVLVARKP